VELAHQRMAHVAPSTLKKMETAGAVSGLQLGGKPEEMPSCEACMMGKATKQPFPDVSFTPVDSKLDLVSA